MSHGEGVGCLVCLVLNKMGHQVWPQLHIGSPVAANLVIVWGWKYGQYLKKSIYSQNVHPLLYVYRYHENSALILSEVNRWWKKHFHRESKEWGESSSGVITALHRPGHTLSFCSFSALSLQISTFHCSSAEATEVTLRLPRAKLYGSSLLSLLLYLIFRNCFNCRQLHKWIQVFSHIGEMCFTCVMVLRNRETVSDCPKLSTQLAANFSNSWYGCSIILNILENK